MRSSLTWLLTVSAAMTLAACAPDEATEQRHTKALHASRDEVTLRLAIAAEGAGDNVSAERMYNRIAENSPSADSALNLAGFYSRQKQDDQALGVLGRANATYPGNADIQRALANHYITAGDPQKALAMLDEAIAAHPGQGLLYNSRGVALDRLGRYGEAQQSYLKAIELLPEDATDFKTNLSMSYILAGAYDKAVTLLLPLLDKPDTPPIVRQNLALAYGLKGDSDAALKLGQKDLSIRQAQENVRFYRMLAAKNSTGGSKAKAPEAPADIFPRMEPPVAAAAQAEEAAEEETAPEPTPAPTAAPSPAPTPAPTPAPAPAPAPRAEAAPAPMPKRIAPEPAPAMESVDVSTQGVKASPVPPPAPEEVKAKVVMPLKPTSEASFPMPVLRPDK